ncbi:MAG: phage capsid protein [Gammaproteobacteria bacterium]|nr:MAG: phage capsid protein [Gammaproteobacteria bacterium]
MSKQRSVMKHQFSQVPKADIPRSSFDRSHGYKTTFDSGYLVPIFIDEALPGDTFNLNMTGFSRLATPIFPVMDNMYMETFFFAVPIRLIWDNWQRFNGEQLNPGDSTDFLIPITTSPVGGYAPMSLQDYMGIPTGIGGLEHSTLWNRAYNLIWNEWFRDQNLQNMVAQTAGDGPDAPEAFELLRRGKRHDYFTSGLPWPQKDNGNPVTIPLGDTAEVLTNFTGAEEIPFMSQITGEMHTSDLAGQNADNLIYADLTTATATTINQLRQAFQIQKMLERDARGGTRYTEVIKAHFQVSSPDARLQRPEYLGGGSSTINITPVANTIPTDLDPTTPQGTLAGFGTTSLHNHGFTKSFTEHCVLIGLVNVRADITYQNGLNRMFSRQTRYDHYWPALSHIGEQEIKNKEIFAQGDLDLVADEAVFAYQERFAEYRYKPSQITGRFRSSDPVTLDAWHLSQEFATLPTLSDQFIQDNPPIDRIIAVQDEPQFLFDAYFKLRCARPMPMYGVPGLIDHF